MTTASAPVPRWRNLPISRVFAAAGLLALALPTLVSVARQHWSTEEGMQGPIILATGIWLIWRARSWLAKYSSPLRSWAWGLLMIPLVVVYAFARAYNILSVETVALYLIGVLAGLTYWGPAAMRRLWFPVLYFAFLIVLPGALIVEATQPLKLWISAAAVELLYALGYPVAQSGASIQIAQYELLVETACAGLGSLLTLSAVGLLYVHLRWNSGIRYGAALLMAIVPLAVLANFARVILLVLLTYYFGDGVAQGIAHDLAGMFMLIVTIAGMIAIDAALHAAARHKRPAHD